MLVGMGTVFLFLTALVIAMSLMATIVRRYQPPPPDAVSERDVAVITAAIRRHRRS